MLISPLHYPNRTPLRSPVSNDWRLGLKISALFSAQPGRKGFYYGSSYDECLAINNAAVAAGRPQDCVLFDDPAGTVPVLSALQTTRGRGLLKDRSGNGCHMVQPTAAARGEISRRYNLLSDTNFNSAVVGLVGSGGVLPTSWTVVTPQGLSVEVVAKNIDPLLGGCRIRIFGTAIGGLFRLQTSTLHTSPSGGGKYVGSQIIKAVSGSLNGISNMHLQHVNLTPGGSPFFDPFVSGTLEQARRFCDPNSSTTGVVGVRFELRFTVANASAVDITLDIAAPDSRLSADAIPSIPAYQRVTSATDYDEAGFPAYWRGQTDDWAYADVDPAGATKALVMWAGQKMSDAAVSSIIEFGNLGATAQGIVGLMGPVAAGIANYNARSNGNASVIPQVNLNTHAAPNRHWVSVSANIQSDQLRMAVNGGAVATSSNDQGDGSYPPQRTFFGSRAGTSLFANIREHAPPMALFMQPADPGLSAAQIALLDKLYAKAVGVA